MLLTKKVSLFGNLIRLLPCIITWSLWGSRCKVRMEGLKYNKEQMWKMVKTWIQILAHDLKVQKWLSV